MRIKTPKGIHPPHEPSPGGGAYSAILPTLGRRASMPRRGKPKPAKPLATHLPKLPGAA